MIARLDRQPGFKSRPCHSVAVQQQKQPPLCASVSLWYKDAEGFKGDNRGRALRKLKIPMHYVMIRMVFSPEGTCLS